MLERLGEWEQAVAAYYLCLHFSGATAEVSQIICQVSDMFNGTVAQSTNDMAVIQLRIQASVITRLWHNFFNLPSSSNVIQTMDTVKHKFGWQI